MVFRVPRSTCENILVTIGSVDVGHHATKRGKNISDLLLCNYLGRRISLALLKNKKLIWRWWKCRVLPASSKLQTWLKNWPQCRRNMTWVWTNWNGRRWRLMFVLLSLAVGKDISLTLLRRHFFVCPSGVPHDNAALQGWVCSKRSLRILDTEKLFDRTSQRDRCYLSLKR